MNKQSIQERIVLRVDNHNVIYVEKGQGEELRHHLAAHAISATVRKGDPDVDLVDVDGTVDPEVLQAIIDQWEG